MGHFIDDVVQETVSSPFAKCAVTARWRRGINKIKSVITPTAKLEKGIFAQSFVLAWSDYVASIVGKTTCVFLSLTTSAVKKPVPCRLWLPADGVWLG